MLDLQTQNRRAGVRGGSEMGGPGSGPAADGYTPILPPTSSNCQTWRRHCLTQVARHIALAERWLDLSETTP